MADALLIRFGRLQAQTPNSRAEALTILDDLEQLLGELRAIRDQTGSEIRRLDRSRHAVSVYGGRTKEGRAKR